MQKYLLFVLLSLAISLPITDSEFALRKQDSTSYWVIVRYQTEDQLAQVTPIEKSLNGFVSLYTLQSDAASLAVFSNGKEIAFEGDWEAQDVVNFVFDNLRDYAFKRVGKVPKKNVKEAEAAPSHDETDVIVLTEADLEESILNSKEPWIVEFYAPWCGHCKKLAPEWAKVATELKGQVKVAKMDASGEFKAKDKYKIKGFPTIHFFGAGDKIDGEFETYDGARDFKAIVDWTKETNKKLKPLHFEQLKSQEQFQQECLSTQGLCLLFFVQHISECDEECRQNYLSVYLEAVKPLKSKPLVHFWSQAGDQYEFEEALGITGAGYPSILAVSPKKQLYSKMRGSFNGNNVSKFINNLLAGKEQVQKYQRLQKIESI